MTAPATYEFDNFFIALVDRIMSTRGEDSLPIDREVFGIPLFYDRRENSSMHPVRPGALARGEETEFEKIIDGWTYTLGRRGVWSLTMTNRPSDVEKFNDWIVEGDLEAAHRDLSLLKLAAD